MPQTPDFKEYIGRNNAEELISSFPYLICYMANKFLYH